MICKEVGKRLLILLLLLLPCVLRAQVNVELVGESANAAGKRVELLCYEDMLTLQERVLDTAVVDSTGRFRLACYITYPRLVVVQVECYSQSFYIEPGRRYEVWLPEFRWEQNEERNVYLDPVALPLEFLNLPADELNLQMLAFEQTVDSVMDTMRMQLDFKYRRRRSAFDSLASAVQQRVPDGKNLFFNRYKAFLLAQMRYSMGFASRKQMLEKVLPQPVLYHDECYMRVLFDVLSGMVSQGLKKVPKWRMTEWVQSADLDRYLDSLGTEPLLYDEQLRELAAIVALRESLFDVDYDHEGAVRMLVALAQRSKWAEHRLLAERVVDGRRSEAGGRQSELTGEAFTLVDVDGRRVSLDSLRGKWVYMSFVRVDDPNSLREMETLAHFKDSVYAKHDDVVFVTVACDREFQKMFHLLRNNRRGARYTWTWLHFDGNYRWLESLGVVSYPWFILFDPDGQRPYTVTPAPGSGFLLHAPWEKHEVEYDKLEFTD